MMVGRVMVTITDQIQDDGSDQWSLITMVLMMVVVRVMVIMLVM